MYIARKKLKTKKLITSILVSYTLFIRDLVLFNNSIVEEISFIDNYLLDTLGIIKSKISDYNFVSKQLHLKRLYLSQIKII